MESSPPLQSSRPDPTLETVLTQSPESDINCSPSHATHPSDSNQKSSQYCQYGDKCYRKDPDHIKICHSQPSPASINNQSASQSSQTLIKHCPYGSACYRQNLDHIRECHQGDLSQRSSQYCQYGDKCYRKDPDHIKNYHSQQSRLSSQPSPASINNQSASQSSQAPIKYCSYGSACYRQNPDHIREYHQPGFTPVSRDSTTTSLLPLNRHPEPHSNSGLQQLCKDEKNCHRQNNAIGSFPQYAPSPSPSHSQNCFSIGFNPSNNSLSFSLQYTKSFNH